MLCHVITSFKAASSCAQVNDAQGEASDARMAQAEAVKRAAVLERQLADSASDFQRQLDSVRAEPDAWVQEDFHFQGFNGITMIQCLHSSCFGKSGQC